MKYFTINELCYSSTAVLRGIANFPTPEISARLVELVDKALDPIRIKFGKGISVNSGYRCPALNKAIGGSSTSAHCSGYAADTKPSNGDMAAYQRCVLDWSKTNKFDQIIIEYPNGKNLAKWIHVGIKSPSGAQRKQILYTTDGKVYRTINNSNWKRFYEV